MNICVACKKTTSMVNIRLSSAGTWHAECFQCNRCQKVLSNANFCEKGAVPFCQACYTKRYGPKGLIAGVMANTFQSGDRVMACTIEESKGRPVSELVKRYNELAKK